MIDCAKVITLVSIRKKAKQNVYRESKYGIQSQKILSI